MSDQQEPLQIEELADGVRMIFPVRELGMLRWAGLIPVGFGMVFSGFALAWIIGASLMTGNAPLLVRIFFPAFGLIFFIAGLYPIFFGLTLMMGHSRIELSGDWLRWSEGMGAFRKSWRVRADQVQVLHLTGGRLPWNDQRRLRTRVVHASSPTLHDHPSTGDVMQINTEGLWSLRALTAQGKAVQLANGYTYDMLITAAQELVRQLARRTGQTIPLRVSDRLGRQINQQAGVTVTESTGIDPQRAGIIGALAEMGIANLGDSGQVLMTEHPMVQPVGSTATLKRNSEGFTLHIPPLGLKRMWSLLFFAVIWLGFSLTMMIVVINVALRGDHMAWVGVAFISLFVAIGFGMVYYALNVARQSVIFDVIGDILLVTQSGLRGTQQIEWTSDQIDTIQRAFSGTSINKRPLLQIQIKLTNGKIHKYLTGRSDEELLWIVDQLRRGLPLDRSKPLSDPTPVIDDD